MFVHRVDPDVLASKIRLAHQPRVQSTTSNVHVISAFTNYYSTFLVHRCRMPPSRPQTNRDVVNSISRSDGNIGRARTLEEDLRCILRIERVKDVRKALQRCTKSAPRSKLCR